MSAHHPDGTPIHPDELRGALRSATGDLLVELTEDQALYNAVWSEDLQVFTDTMQQRNYDRMFNIDGSAKDIAGWRQSVREDAFYGKLLQDNAPDMYMTITNPSVADEEVQRVLRQQQQAAIAQQQKSEL